MRKVFLDDLPKKYGKGMYINKLCYDWKNSVGYKLKFIYDNIEDELEIVNYYKIKYQNYLDIKYNDRTVSITTNVFINCGLGNLLNKHIQDYKYNIGDIIENKFSKIEIIEQIRIPRKIDMQKGYKYKCLKCGNEDQISESKLDGKRGCNVCCFPSKKVLKGYNDLWTTHPHIAKLLKDKELGYKISQGKHNYALFVCPNCRYEKLYLPYNIIRFGFSCPKCGDGISFANKVGFNLLEQLGIDFIPEHNFYNYRLDFYFELNNKKYNFEMDGGIGHGNKNTLINKTAEESKEDDKQRDIFINQHNIEVIRIDCLKSELEYIKTNILNSQLNNLFDLSIIDWNKCEEFTNKSLVKIACDYWNNGIKSTKGIAKLMKLCHATIVSYLNKGVKSGFCDYNKGKRKVIQLLLENKFIKEWESITKAEKELNIRGISLCCSGKAKTAGKFKWMYKEDYEEMLLELEQIR